MRAVVYLRQSKDHDGTELAVARQREDIRKLCAERGWAILREYKDNDRSASNGKARPDYEDMLRAADRGEFDVIVCWHMDRLLRRLADLVPLIPRLEAAGVRVATVSGDLNLDTDAGRLVARILASVAEGEIERKAARQRRAGLQRAELGTPKAGPRPFGYERDMITIRESEARALRAAYASLLTGGSLLGISKALAADGFRASSGKPFHHATIRTMLRNPRYGGLRGYTTSGPDGKLHTEIIGPAAWQGVVDEETWRAAYAVMNDGTRRSNGVGPARKHLLSGLALCGRCDDGTTVRVNYRGRPNADGKSVRTYRCRAHPHLTREAEWCDWRVRERVIARLSRDDARDLLIDEQREDLAALRAEKATLQMRLDQLAEDYADGTITRAQLKAGSERLRTRLADLEGRMAHVDRAPLLADLVTAEDVRAVWSGIGLDRQRAVIDLLYTVTLMPRPAGNAPPPLESVRMEPRNPL